MHRKSCLRYRFIQAICTVPVLSGLVVVLTIATASNSAAGPWLAPGDVWLKSDIQVLADAGIIKSPISSWPLSWGDIAEDVNGAVNLEGLRPGVLSALRRVRRLSNENSRVSEPTIDFGLRLSDSPQQIRGFQDTPRGDRELWARAQYTGERFAVGLQGALVSSDPLDDQESRADGSYAAIALGNWLVGASMVDRWWGPGWNGSLILGSNSRPIPALVVERNFSSPFESRWLRWIGRWSTSVIWGELESERAVPNTRFFGWRVNFRPLDSLEIGLLRTAQWCGDDRECDFDAFAKVLAGDSNLDGAGGVDVANQLAGFDMRWASPLGSAPYAVYGQFIGEDEAGGFPSRFLGQFGIEAWGQARQGMLAWRAYIEYADTTCQFNENSRIFNCAYENTFYPDGYRYRGRSIGYATDNDTRSVVVGTVLNDVELGELALSVRRMDVNRGGAPEPRHTVSSVPQKITDLDVHYRRQFRYVDLTLGLGAERRENLVSLADENNLRIYAALTFRL